jgi:hypothetical protein
LVEIGSVISKEKIFFFISSMAAKLKIEKGGDEILIVPCCFSVSQNELQILLQLHGKE